MDQVGGYRCDCKPGYTAAKCETSKDLRFFIVINEIIVRELGTGDNGNATSKLPSSYLMLPERQTG